MAVYKVFVDAGSEDGLSSGVAVLSRQAGLRAGIQFHGSWRGTYGAYVILEADATAQVPDLIEGSGLGIGPVSELSQDEVRECRFALPEDDLWCPHHRIYHAPPAHNVRQ